MRYEVRYPTGERARWVGPSEGLYDSLHAAVLQCIEEARAVGDGGLIIHDRYAPSLRITIAHHK